MLQRYKLRLGDGTVLLVDFDGLNPWLQDRQATVQTEGSRQWRPLREVVARERARARRQTQTVRPAVHESLPPRRPSTPREEQATSSREDGLPLIPPPPKKTPTTTPTPPAREDGLPLTPPPPRNEPLRRAAPTEAPALVESRSVATAAPETGPQIPPPDASVEIDLASIAPNPVFVDAAPAAALAPFEPRLGDPDEIVPAALPPEPMQPAATPEPVSGEGPRTLFEPASLLESEPVPPVEPTPLPKPEPAVATRPSPDPAAVASVEGPAQPLVFHEAEPEPEPSEELPPTIVVGAPRQMAVEPDASESLDDIAGAAFGNPEGISALAEDPCPVEAAVDRQGIAELPVIPFKAESPSPTVAPTRSSGDHTSTSPRTRLTTHDGARSSRPSPGRAEPEHREAPAWVANSRVQVVLRGAAAMGAALSRGLSPINRLERGEPALEIEEGAFTRFRARVGASVSATTTRVAEATRGSLAGLQQWLADRRREAPSPVPTLFAEPAPAADERRLPIEPPPPVLEAHPVVFSEPAARVARPTPAPRPTEPAPLWKSWEPSPTVARAVPVSDLPVVPLAEAIEARNWPDEDVYDGPGLVARLSAAWRWTVRFALVAAVIGGVAFAVVQWRTWFPQAAQVGQATFNEIDRAARASELAAQQQRVLTEAAERLPYLTPESVRLILSHSPTGVLEIPDIFEVARDAADWGSWALTDAEATELRSLRGELLVSLGPTDRSRVKEYDHARESGLVFPLDNRLGVLTWARGAQGLPPDHQERLRELLAKAVAAGLAPGHAPASATYRP